ncbi:MAG: hypothetical protein ABI852_21855, partial [Gemmatimonadaceae bacterium]
MTVPPVLVDIQAELASLRLDMATAPNIGLDIQSADELLATLRRLEPGVPWSDVFPEVSSEKASTTHVPLGPFDHQVPTTAPAVTLVWPLGTSDVQLHTFVDLAINAGWPVYGAGFHEIENPNPDLTSRIAQLVFTQHHEQSRSLGDNLSRGIFQVRAQVDLPSVDPFDPRLD